MTVRNQDRDRLSENQIEGVKRFVSEYKNTLGDNTRLFALCSRLEIAPVSGFKPRHNQRIGQSVYNYYFENCVLPLKMQENFPELFYCDDKVLVVAITDLLLTLALDELKSRLAVKSYADIGITLDHLNEEILYAEISRSYEHEEASK